MISLWSRRGRLFLGAIGLLLVILPVIAVNVLATVHARDLAQRTASEIAGEFVARTETAIDSGLGTLNDLSLLGIANCSQRDLDLMRRAVYANFWITEVGIVRSDGEFLCNHIGDAKLVNRLSQLYPSSNTDVSLQLVELGGSGRRGLMLLWRFSADRGLSAIIPSDALSAIGLPGYLRDAGRVTVSLSDGAVIARLGPENQKADSASGQVVRAKAASRRFPIDVELSAPLAAFAAQSGDFFTHAKLGSVLLSALVFALFIYVLRGPPVALARLSEAVERGEILPYYQPVIDLRSGRIVGCEVLMRWRKPDGTLIGPDEFIRLAESERIAWPMTLSLMRRVRADLEPTFGQRPALKISINLFNAHFTRLRTVRDVQHVFGGSAIAYSQLVFELTERKPLGDIERARVVIRRLQNLGARVALDDAGTGHAGLAYLHQLGVNVVKIDKLFVDTIGEGGAATPIIDSLIKLGHDLGMEVVAEGVETFKQLEYLREHKADSAQGFLFSPPLPAQAFIQLVRSMEQLAPADQARRTEVGREDEPQRSAKVIRIA